MVYISHNIVVDSSGLWIGTTHVTDARYDLIFHSNVIVIGFIEVGTKYMFDVIDRVKKVIMDVPIEKTFVPKDELDIKYYSETFILLSGDIIIIKAEDMCAVMHDCSYYITWTLKYRKYKEFDDECVLETIDHTKNEFIGNVQNCDTQIICHPCYE